MKREGRAEKDRRMGEAREKEGERGRDETLLAET